MALDAANDRLVVVDRSSFDGDLQAIRLSDGANTIILGGDAFEDPRQVTLSPDDLTAFVYDRAVDSIFAVNLASGARTTHATAVGGRSETFFFSKMDLATDAIGKRVLRVHEERAELVGFDLLTGERTIVSGASRGTGPALDHPAHVIVSDDGLRALVLTDAGLVSIVLATGDRTLISPNTAAFGRVISESSALAADTHAERVLITDRAQVFSVDLVTGQRVVLTGFY
jgi:hypothetical protein